METISKEKMKKLVRYERKLAVIDTLYKVKTEIHKLIEQADAEIDNARNEYIDAD